jgi:hypothetical protein
VKAYGAPLDAIGKLGAVAMARPLTIVREKGALAFALAESLTPIVIGNTPTCDGVPVRAPLEDKVSPVGRAPLIDQTYGGAPPVAAKDCV